MTVLACASVLGGFAWVAGGRIVVIGPWTLVTWHVVAGIALAAVLVVHLAPRRWRLLVPGRRAPARAAARLSRRSFLAGSALAAAGIGLWAGAETLDRVARRRPAIHRLALAAGRRDPAGDHVPRRRHPADRPGRLAAHASPGRSSARSSSTSAGLAALGTERRRATLDCTSGWAIETDWDGVSLGRVLDAAGASANSRWRRRDGRHRLGRVTRRSRRRAAACSRLGVAGQPLPAGNGAPCRLVVPGRRGLDWVKWVSEIRVLPG